MRDLEGIEELIAKDLAYIKAELALSDAEFAYFLIRLGTDYYLKSQCKKEVAL